MTTGTQEAKMDAEARPRKTVLKSLRIGNTKHVFDLDSEAKVLAAVRKQARRTGEAIIHQNGGREWYEWRAITDLTKTGSDVYQWDKSGDKVRANLYYNRTTEDGARTESMIGTGFRPFEGV